MKRKLSVAISSEALELLDRAAATEGVSRSEMCERSVRFMLPVWMEGRIAVGKNKSECCDADIWGSLGDGVLLGTCSKCREMVCRMNPRTGANEWLDGESPWTPRDDLRRMSADEPRDTGVLRTAD